MYDADGSGSMDVNELKDAVKVLGFRVSDQELRKLVMEADADGSG